MPTSDYLMRWTVILQFDSRTPIQSHYCPLRQQRTVVCREARIRNDHIHREQ